MKCHFPLLATAVILLFCIFISGCTQDLSSINIWGSKSSRDTIVDANNRFSLNLYSTLAGDGANNGKNLFFSPWSLSSAMAVTYEGARNKTADEIRDVFYFPDNRSELREGYTGLNAEINQNNPTYTLRTANALWTEKSYSFLPEYSHLAQKSYGANAESLDFINDAEGSRNIINAWVAKNTDDKITNVIAQGAITPGTRLIITNAIYFKGTWVKQFDQSTTSEQKFWLSPGTDVPVMMMVRNDTNSVFGYGQTDNIQILELPYRSGSGKPLSMLILLPSEGNLTRLEKTLDIQKLTALKKSMTSQLVMIHIPKFRLDTGYQISPTLTSMGMPAAFSTSADLSGMDGTQNLMIDKVVHKAYIDVNEEGTEAAGATFVHHVLKGDHQEPLPPEFWANHPFIFIIQDNENGNILFMGRVTNPNEG
jgi:serpin B